MDHRTEEALASLKARLLTAKRTKAETLGVPPYVLRQAADTIERLSAALEARTDDLQALKIEYAVVLASSRCQLCGEMVEPPRSFCSTCCAR